MAEFAVTKLYDDCVSLFAAEETAGAFYFGWNEPDKQHTENRVVIFVPGDPGGNIGNLLPAKNVGVGLARNLATIDEMLTIIVDAYDPTDASGPTSERSQYAAARLLFDDVLRAIHLSAHGRYTLRKINWLAEKKVRRKGAAISILLTVQGTIPDAPSGSVGTGTETRLTVSSTVSELDVSTNITLTSEEP